ncbi:putative aldouronate transport system substrate-binding protein [Caldicoprobacter guelmensis]|uniref:ABC transporter substrate-binding protein n=1 Tax=Caldicoprobacter guelmensis TaxID=1170224 RepID=UPI00195E7492|nr:extracellular solute-binding protein [Caldicoprobacter guelmensis]MBM7582222.1 putative aldouronate transport system substrate-binding protein [Caldicoprobacter guelmensis]
MSITKKILVGILVLMLIISAFTGCTKKETSQESSANQGNAKETPATSEPSNSADQQKKDNKTGGVVKILTSVTGGKDEEEMKLFAKELGEATGLTVIMERPPSDYNNTLMRKLNSGEKLDLIYLNMPQYLELVNQGALLDLTDYIKSSKIYSDPSKIDPRELKDIEVKGRIYAGFNKKEVHRVVALNRVHLEKAGIDYKSIEPSLNGYYNVFKKLKETIKTANYYPYNVVMSQVFDLQPWFASVGLKTGVVIDEKDGKKYVPISTDDAIPVWEWIAKLYKEGLIDPAASVDQTKDMRNKMSAASQLTSVTVDWAAWVGLHNANALAAGIGKDQYEIVSLPGTKTPNGSYMLTKGAASLWAIPKNAENPEGAWKIIEFFATQEGGVLLSVGIKGHDYTIDDKGNYVLTDIGKQHGCDHGAPVPILETFKHPIGYNPGVEEALSYGKYASIELPIPNEGDYKEIVGKWAVQIMEGKVSVADGLKNMRNELLSRKVTDK